MGNNQGVKVKERLSQTLVTDKLQLISETCKYKAFSIDFSGFAKKWTNNSHFYLLCVLGMPWILKINWFLYSDTE